MVRLEKLNEAERNKIIKIGCPSFETRPWVSGPPLNQRRVAIITTAGLHLRHDRPFQSNSGDFYRVIPGEVQANDLVMSHQAPSFDRTGFQRDWNVVFPLDRLREMAAEGIISSLAAFHYSFGTVLSISEMETAAKEIAGLLMRDKVNAVLLFPV